MVAFASGFIFAAMLDAMQDGHYVMATILGLGLVLFWALSKDSL